MAFSSSDDLAYGIDLSHHQSPDKIDYGKLAANGTEFAILRSSDGLKVLDKTLEPHLQRAREAGMAVGVYQFCRLDTDPEDAARSLVDRATDAGWRTESDLPLWADLEKRPEGMSNEQATNWVTTFLATCDQAAKRPTGIYTGPRFWNGSIGARQFYDRPLWAARYPKDQSDIDPTEYLNRQPKPVYGWGRDTVLWQYTGWGRIEGYSGNLDRNIIRREDLESGLRSLRPLPNRKLLRKGDEGELVETLQVFLTAVGQKTGSDGKFGKNTKTKVEAFQSFAGLSVDGLVGNDTWKALVQFPIDDRIS